MSDPERRLAAILSADAVGYSRLMAEDEAGTIRTLNAYRHEISGLVGDHRGRVVDAPGDNVLAEFPTALDAVECAIEMQRVLEARNAGLPPERRMEFRVGVHLGDVAIEGERVYGDGVNIAARLEGLAESGGICISRSVYEVVHGKLALAYDDLGDQTVKNIPDPVHAYRVRVETQAQSAARKARRDARHWVGVVGALVVLVGIGAVLWHLLGRTVDDPTPAAESVQSIAVLPFANMSGDPEQEFFSDGISEELLNVLAKVKGLRVTSRTSAFAFKGSNTSIPEIAEKLDVEHVLEGSVRMAGDRVRITTQLIEVSTDSHLWSESFDRELSDIFAVQDEIAAKVGEALEVALLGADASPIRASPETSIEAYSDYLLARQKVANASVSKLIEAELLLKGVIEREPDYAPAYSALAGTYWSMADWGRLSPSEASARMMPLVDQALSLDDRMAEAWLHLADAHWANGDLESARTAEERALELDPKNPLVLRFQIFRWWWTHEPERGLVYADELLRVDPLSLKGLSRAFALYERLGRFDDAERMIERMRSIDPQSLIYLWDAWALASSRGDLVTALEMLEETARIDIGEPEAPSFIAMHYFDLGDGAAAKYWTDAASQIDSEAPNPRIMAALLHLYHDEQAEAVAIARELARPDSHSRWGTRGIALRILATSDLAAGNHEDIIARYLTHYPELADAKFQPERSNFQAWEAFLVASDLASAYLCAGEMMKAESLLSLIESELPHWSQTGAWFFGYGYADVELYTLRGDRERALAALREGAAKGIPYMWRFHLLHNPNLESLRDTPEFAATIAEIEADMAEQLARVREMQRTGELTAIPELVVE